ncbi:GNAT family N-acetyltransferase [Gymnodinialimonas sp. 2305UL16-5]|uniref:GNAT family N-acetyltransferase n=1 Tax=Gymnodinialimonas mytili TaxID=3126503 RepID=UPI003097F2D0
MDLRPATALDLPDIARLHESNWRRDYANVLPEIALGARLSDYMAATWHGGALIDHRVIAARDEDDRLMGFAAMQDEGPHGCAYLDALHVAPKARAQGVGRALMTAIAVLSMPGALSLEVLSANRPARAIYRRWGGRETSEFQDTILDVSVPAVAVGWRDTAALLDRLRGGSGNV